MINYLNYIQHKCEWWWGSTITVIHKEGIRTIDVQFANDAPNVAYICGLSVFTPKQRNGLGKELLLMAEDIARKHWKKFARLIVDKDKEWLVRWYERCGYMIFYTDERGHTMYKQL